MSTQSLGLGDRLRNVGRLLEFLKGLDLSKLLGLIGAIDLAKLPEIIAALGRFQSAADWRGKVRAALDLAKLIASMTATATDDQLLAAIDKIAGDLGLFAAFSAHCENACAEVEVAAIKAAGAPGDPPAAAYFASVSQQANYAAAGLNLAVLIELVKLVVEIINRLRGNG